MNSKKSSKQNTNISSNILRAKQKALENLAEKLIQANTNNNKQKINAKKENK